MNTKPIESSVIGLADWRRQMAEAYAAVRRAPEAGIEVEWQSWRMLRNELFKSHPHSPLAETQRPLFRGLGYFNYDPKWRIAGAIAEEVDRDSFEVYLDTDGRFCYTRVAEVRFESPMGEAKLSLFWIEGYGGGVFLPFKDSTNGHESYGGGRYLYDTLKGADLGVASDRIVLDFNFAYNPSCAYHPRWVCPLPPQENHLPFPVTAGELSFK